MTILRGDLSPQPSGARTMPAMGDRDSVSPISAGRRILSLAMLASASALGLMAQPAMARDVALPYAALAEVQTSESPAQAATPATAAIAPPAVTAPASPAPATATSAPTAPAATPPAASSNGTPAATDPNSATQPANQTETGKTGGESDIVVSARNKAPPGDPLIGINLKSYAAVQAADKAVVGPAAMAYKKSLPSPLRQGIHNLLLNMREPPVIVAYLVEHKIGKAFETLGRLTINTTLGIGGLFDIAKRKPFHLPWHANGMADAMGFYGIKPGPYFFLPLIGPTTLRDLIGTTIDRVGFPALYADELRGPAYGLAVTIVGGLDDRVAIDPQVREFREHSPDPYAAMKRFYMTRRQAEIDALHGKPPLKDKLSDYDFSSKPKPDSATTQTPSTATPAAPAAPAAPAVTPPAVPNAAPAAPATTASDSPSATPPTPPSSTPAQP